MLHFNFNENFTLENDIIRLIPLATNHFEPLFQIANTPEIWTYFLEKGLGRSHFTIYFASALKAREQYNQYSFAIFDKRTQQYAGMTRLYDISNELQNIKIGHTWYGVDFQGTGLNKNCKYLLFKFIFDHLKFERIGFGASAKNERSIRAMKRIGCQIEGYLRSFIPEEGGERTDVILLSILKKEWKNNVKSLIQQQIQLT